MSDAIEEVKVKVTGDESSLDNALGKALGLLNKFAGGVEKAGKKIESGLGKAMGATGREADVLTTATERVGVSTRRMGDDTGRGVSAVSRLAQEYRAGKMSADQYVASLEKVAKEAKDGSAEQLAALARLRSERERSARAAEQAAKQEATAARMVAKEVERAQKEQADSVARTTRETTRARQQAAREAQRAAKQESDAALQAAADAEKAAKRQEDAIRKVFEAEGKRHSAKLQAAGAVGDGIQGTGNFLTKAVTAPLVLGASYAVKVTLDYDSAMNDVKKFTQGTKLQLGTLEKDLRTLSLDKTVGTDFTDLANIASFGSQLGIERKNLKEFVKDVAYLGKAGDMSGEQAAVGLAKISSAMQLGQGKIKGLASSLAAMGNLGSSTLGEILETSKRFAAEGRMAKLDPSAVFAYANAVTSLGQEAEAGGTAISRTFDLVDKSVVEGGKSLELFASVAGMTSKDFVKAYQTDAAGAVQKFFAGLDKQGQVAGRVAKILKTLGIDDIRQQAAVKNLAAGHAQLAQNLKESARAYAAADEHQKKAAIAAQSYKNQLEQQKREIMDAAFELGKSLVPTLLSVTKAAKPLIEDARHLAEEFAKLSPEVQQAWIKVGLGVAVIGPLLSGIGSLVGWVIRLREGFALLKAAKTAEELLAVARAAKDAASGTSAAATATGQLVPGLNAAGGEATAAAGKFNLFKTSVSGVASAFAILTAAIIAYNLVKPVYDEMKEAQKQEAQAHEDLKNNPLRESVTKMAEGRSDAQQLKAWRKTLKPDEVPGWQTQVPDNIKDIFLRRGLATKADDGSIQAKSRKGMLWNQTWDMAGDYRAALAQADSDYRRGKIATKAMNRTVETAATTTAQNNLIAAAPEGLGKRTVAAAINKAIAGSPDVANGCATLVTSALKTAGAKIAGSAVAFNLQAQLRQGGSVPKGEMKDWLPGDAVFFEGPGFGSLNKNGGSKKRGEDGAHTGIYVGGGMMVHEGQRGIKMVPVSSVMQKSQTAMYALTPNPDLVLSDEVRNRGNVSIGNAGSGKASTVSKTNTPRMQALAPFIASAAGQTGVNPLLLKALVFSETEGDRNKYINRNSNGTSDYGPGGINSAILKELFHIDPVAYEKSGRQNNEAENILLAAKELAHHTKAEGGDEFGGLWRFKGKSAQGKINASKAWSIYEELKQGGGSGDGGGGGDTGNVPFNESLLDTPKVKRPPTRRDLSPTKPQSLYDLTGGDLDKAPTSAKNYEAKRDNLESLLSEKRFASQGSKTFDEYAFSVEALKQKLLLAGDAIRSTGKEIDALKPKVAQSGAAYNQSYKAMEAQKASMLVKREKGGAYYRDSAEDNATLSRLEKEQKAKRRVYDEEYRLLKQNQQVGHQAMAQERQDLDELTRLQEAHNTALRTKWLKQKREELKSGKITRPQFEDEMRASIGRIGATQPDADGYKDALGDSVTNRQTASKDLHKKTLLLDHKDFDAQREELDEEVAALTEAGVKETEIVAYEAKRREQIRHAEFERNHEDQRAAHRADYESGTQTLSDYRSYLVSLLAEVQAEYGATSAEAAKLNLEVLKLDWDAASQEADKYRESLDQGDISIQQYITGLEGLRNTLPQVSSEYRRMSREIDQSNRKIVADAHRTADETGRAFGDAAVQILRRSKTIGQAAKETLDSAVDGWIKDTVKKVVSGFIFKAKMKDNNAKLEEIENKRRESIEKEQAGVIEFGAHVDKFIGGVNQMNATVGARGTAKDGAGTGTTGDPAAIINATANATTNKTLKDALGKTSTAISVGKDLSSKNASGALSTAASAGWLGKAAASAMPWVGVGLAALSLFGGSGLFSSQYRGFNTKEGGSVFSKIGKGDHTGLIDSGLSGPDGLRQLAAKAEAQKAQLSAPRTNVWAPNIGSIQINTLPGQNSTEIAQEVMRMFNEKAAMENSGMGSG